METQRKLRGQLRVFLAIHTFGNGIKHIRRWCPDDPDLFLGFQKQTDNAKHWLAAHGNPEWGDGLLPDDEPFETVEL